MKYGAPAEANELEAERWAFLKGLTPEQGGLGRLGHFWRVAQTMFPAIERNPWLDLQVRSLLESQWVGWPGCAGSGKTFGSGYFGVVWWAMWPEETSVILVSTTKGMIRKRAWGVVQGLFGSLRGRNMEWGNFVDSKTVWQSRKGDDKNAIFAVAVEGGSVSKAVDNIKGVHTRRQMVIVDEATSVPEAIFEACSNLYSTPEDFLMLVIGNPWSRFDEMGKFCEPAGGWSSVSVDDEQWESRVKLNGKQGTVVRFDAEKTPNLIHGVRWPFLVRPETLANARSALGEGNPRYWAEYRGFWAPEGLEQTVLTEVLIANARATDKHTFLGPATPIAGLDPAFGGGDRAVMQFGVVAQVDAEGAMGLELREEVKLEVRADSSEPLTYQIARLAMEACRARGVKPEHLACDANGQSAGVADRLSQEFGPGIRVVGQESPTDRRVSLEDERTAKETYTNRVTESWFAVESYVKSGQFRGLGVAAARQFCQRRWEQQSRKIQMEPKEEFKARLGRSPDEADATALALEAARAAGMDLRGLGKTQQRGDRWSEEVRKVDSMFDPDLLYTEEDVYAADT